MEEEEVEPEEVEEPIPGGLGFIAPGLIPAVAAPMVAELELEPELELPGSVIEPPPDLLPLWPLCK